MKDKVIVFATQQYGDYWSGLGSYATWLIDAMPAHYAVYVICPECNNGKQPTRFSLVNIKGAKWDPTHGKWFSLSWQYAKAITKIAEQKEIRLIHFTDAREAFFSVFLLSSYLKRRIVGTLHDFYFAAFRWNPFFYTKKYIDGWKRWLYYFFVNRIEKLTYKRIPFLISNTFYVKNLIAEAYKLNIRKIKNIYIGLPEYWIKQSSSGRKITRKKNQLLFVGGNFQRKGLLILAQVVKNLITDIPDLKVTVIGRDPNQKKIQKLIARMGILDAFDFKGFVSGEEISDHYRRSTALVMPAQIEAYGLVFLEAVSCGCPVIGSAKGGTEELFEIMGTGQTVDPNDIEGISHAIKNILKGGDLQEQIDQGEVNILSLNQTVDQTKKYLLHLLI